VPQKVVDVDDAAITSVDEVSCVPTLFVTGGDAVTGVQAVPFERYAHTLGAVGHVS
jgi:hypothetical protein